MSELSREEVIRKIGDAVKLVGELCSGGRKWTMSVPARPDYDPDLIIGGALDAALRALSQPPDSEQEQCSYCKQWFSKPVSYHHSTDECRAAELWSKENLTVAEVAELERLPIWPPEKPDSEAVRLLREATIPPAKTEIAWIDRLAAHYGARQMAALRGDKALWNDRDHWLSLTAQDHWHEILEALRAHPARQPAAQSVDIVFDGPPGHEAGRFVEVESPPGKSISFGQWLQRDDGYWVLRINGQPAAQSELPTRNELAMAIRFLDLADAFEKRTPYGTAAEMVAHINTKALELRDGQPAAREPEEQWVSVDERLPENTTAVLVRCPERLNTYCCNYINGQWIIFGGHNVILYERISHWQPLPKPPMLRASSPTEGESK